MDSELEIRAILDSVYMKLDTVNDFHDRRRLDALLASEKQAAYRDGQIAALENVSDKYFYTQYKGRAGMVTGEIVERKHVTAELSRLNSGLEQHNGQ